MARKRMIRQKRVPLPAWEDKLNRAMRFLKRTDAVMRDDYFKYDIIEWHCTINMFGEERYKIYTGITATPLTGTARPKALLGTSYGPFCLNCLTNEYLASNNECLPISDRGNPKDVGVYCVKCGAI